MTAQSNRKNTPPAPDFSLVLSRMEQEILHGKQSGKCAKVLAREDIWSRLGSRDQVRWAELAQMSGHVDLALKILVHVNQNSPSLEIAWRTRLELLTILDRRKELAEVMARCGNCLDQKEQKTWLNLIAAAKPSEKDRTMDEAAAPFMALRERQRLIDRFLEIFAGREDCFARQWVDKKEGKQGYVPVRRPMEPRDVEDHLKGIKTYGMYLLRSDATVTTAVMDVDVTRKFREGKLSGEDRGILRREGAYLMKRIRDMSESAGCAPLVEFSGGKGFHFWFILDRPIPAGQAKKWLDPIREVLYRDLSAFNLEVFPKQASLSGKGMGNLVKFPLGVHRVTGKRSYFYDCRDRGTDAQLAFLMGVKPGNTDQMGSFAVSAKRANVLAHPRLKKWAEDFPELQRLETCCPPLGQIMAGCRQGRACTEREEKIVFQTVGFLARGKTLLHHLLASLPDYNPHLVDFKLSRLRGTPLGCKRIHSLLNFTGDMCAFEENGETYDHPLRHIREWKNKDGPKCEKVENLQDALENLNRAVLQVKRFLD